MEQVEFSGVAHSRPDAFVFHSHPLCALTQAQERWVFWSLAGLTFGGAIGFSLLGYWLVLPFAGLEIGLLAWALETMRQRKNNYETLTIEGDTVVVEWRQGERRGRREMNRLWVHVDCVCATPGRNCHLCLSTQGRATEVGHYLSDEARLQLAADLHRRVRA